MGEEDLTVLQQQNEQIHKDVSELAKAVATVAEVVDKQAKKDEEEVEEQKQAEAEAKMFKRFVKMLKDMVSKGELDLDKDGGNVPKPPGQESKTSVKEPKGQQEPIQGSADETKSKQIPPRPGEEEEEEEPRRREPIVAKKADEEEDEEKEALVAEVAELKASIPDLVQKATEKTLQEKGWKPVGFSPVKKVGVEEVAILKSDEPAKKEEVMKELSKIPQGQLNDMHHSWLRGELKMPEVIE